MRWFLKRLLGNQHFCPLPTMYFTIYGEFENHMLSTADEIVWRKGESQYF